MLILTPCPLVPFTVQHHRFIIIVTCVSFRLNCISAFECLLGKPPPPRTTLILLWSLLTFFSFKLILDSPSPIERCSGSEVMSLQTFTKSYPDMNPNRIYHMTIPFVLRPPIQLPESHFDNRNTLQSYLMWAQYTCWLANSFCLDDCNTCSTNDSV